MARKVFISFLGTNNYVECNYSIDEHYPVRFVQEVLIKNTCKDWTENDKIYIFCTTGAETLNWVDNGQPKPIEEIDKIGLETRLNGLKNQGLKASFEKVQIVEGFSEEEIWQIFDTVYGKLQEGDEIYFDVTHAFRSIPLFSVVLFNYSRFMKSTNIVSIQYGAFEKLGPAFEVRKKPLSERGIAPIIDLTNIARLQEYNEMASNLINFGKVQNLAAIIKQTDKSSQPLKKFADGIATLDQYISINKIDDIKKGKEVTDIKHSLKSVKANDNLPSPIQHIIGELLNATSNFVDKDDYQNIKAAIKWAIKYNMLPQAYTMTQEYIITRVAEHLQYINPYMVFEEDDKATRKDKGVKFRSFVSAILGMPEKAVAEDKYTGILEETINKERAKQVISNDEIVKEIRPFFITLAQKRNDINHGKRSSYSFDNYKKEIENIYSQIIEKYF